MADDEPDDDDWVTGVEAAAMLGLSRNLFQAQVANRGVPSLAAGGSRVSAAPTSWRTWKRHVSNRVTSAPRRWSTRDDDGNTCQVTADHGVGRGAPRMKHGRTWIGA